MGEREDTDASTAGNGGGQPPAAEPGTLKTSPLPGLWRRIFGFALDLILLGLVGTGISFFFFDRLVEMGAWGRLLGVAIAGLYFGTLNSEIGRGQTLGKKLLKIRVVDDRGRYLSLARSLIRFAALVLPAALNNLSLPTDAASAAVEFLIGICTFGIGCMGVVSLQGMRITPRATRQ